MLNLKRRSSYFMLCRLEIVIGCSCLDCMEAYRALVHIIRFHLVSTAEQIDLMLTCTYSQTPKIGFLAGRRNIVGKASDELNSYVLLITPIVIMKTLSLLISPVWENVAIYILLLTFCLLGNYPCFSAPADFFKTSTVSKISFWNNIRVSNSLDPVGPDLPKNCLQRLSADTTRRQRVKGSDCLL